PGSGRGAPREPPVLVPVGRSSCCLVQCTSGLSGWSQTSEPLCSISRQLEWQRLPLWPAHSVLQTERRALYTPSRRSANCYGSNPMFWTLTNFLRAKKHLRASFVP
ncbi:mCG146021, partial [Mus musculus]